jgi:hypothetical protein
LHLALSCPVKPYNRDIAIEGVLAHRIQHFEYEPLVASESMRPNRTDIKTLHSSRKYAVFELDFFTLNPSFGKALGTMCFSRSFQTAV